MSNGSPISAWGRGRAVASIVATRFPALEALYRRFGKPRGVIELCRYFVVSAGALAVDFGLYRGCLQLGFAYPLAGLIGFCAGAVVAYVASVAWVFETRSLRSASIEFVLFMAIGVAGLALTEALLWLQIACLGLPASYSKLGAAGIVFVFNFVVRRAALFKAPKNGPSATRACSQPS